MIQALLACAQHCKLTRVCVQKQSINKKFLVYVQLHKAPVTIAKSATMLKNQAVKSRAVILLHDGLWSFYSHINIKSDSTLISCNSLSSWLSTAV